MGALSLPTVDKGLKRASGLSVEVLGDLFEGGCSALSEPRAADQLVMVTWRAPGPPKISRTRHVTSLLRIAAWAACNVATSAMVRISGISARPMAPNFRSSQTLSSAPDWSRSNSIHALGWPDPHAAKLGRDDGSRHKFVAVGRQEGNAERPLPDRGNAYKPDDSSVRHTANNCELAEVLVERDENTPLGPSLGEYGFVARIFGPLTDPFHIVPGIPDSLLGATPDACIEDDEHYAGINSMRS